MGIEGRTIGVTDIGCNGNVINGIDIDVVHGNHGRAIAVGVGIKRVLPNTIVLAVQGDGGLAAIGASHWMNAMFRADKITCFFINNAGYGRTGGKWLPRH